MINEALLKLLVCPQSKEPLTQIGAELVCKKSKLAYPIVDGIPVLLVEEARKIS
ncbi:MAG: Trm112 family protein [Candidatus Thioglobus sp.]|nr:MAG: Trm112 family protein [Candidatus Thioglobus sp.]KAA0452600.1 MAG: Trm112 family protein [Candidatus Thioglobus sp.]